MLIFPTGWAEKLSTWMDIQLPSWAEDMNHLSPVPATTGRRQGRHSLLPLPTGPEENQIIFREIEGRGFLKRVVSSTLHMIESRVPTDSPIHLQNPKAIRDRVLIDNSLILTQIIWIFAPFATKSIESPIIPTNWMEKMPVLSALDSIT